MVQWVIRVACLALLALASCGPSILVRHQDPSVGEVEVRIDNEPVGTLDYGDDLSVSLDRGYHTVEAYLRGTTSNPWADGGGPWVVYLDDEAYLTLLGLPPEPPAP